MTHETIYRSLFVQAPDELRRELTAACAPHGPIEPGNRLDTRGGSGVVNIGERPAEAEHRARARTLGR